MQIGILGGTGPAGSALAARLASVGYPVVVGSRSADRAAEIVSELVAPWTSLNLPVTPGDNVAAASCEMVVVATPWDSAVATVSDLATHMSGKIVVSMANALVRVGKDFQPLIPPRGSIAASLQAALPDARVVAAFQHVPAKELGSLDHPLDTDVLVCSDHPDATATLATIIGKIPGCRGLDAGLLSNAMAIEALTATMLNLNIRYRTRVAPRFTGIADG
jgi:8-hydroxy-5-deazaflavin:NADPH oxidoreductase